MTKWENLPAPLKVLRQWVCVRSDSKIPMQAIRPEPASASDPDTWSSYEEARQAVEAGHYDGVGFVFREGGGLVGLDIDAAFEDRLLTPPGRGADTGLQILHGAFPERQGLTYPAVRRTPLPRTQ